MPKEVKKTDLFSTQYVDVKTLMLTHLNDISANRSNFNVSIFPLSPNNLKNADDFFSATSKISISKDSEESYLHKIGRAHV